MRDCSPGPAARRKAVSALNACTSRKSSDSASGTCPTSQVAPPSAVRKYVPRVPLAQTMDGETTLMPRSDSSVLLFCSMISARSQIADIKIVRITALMATIVAAERKKEKQPEIRLLVQAD